MPKTLNHKLKTSGSVRRDGRERLGEGDHTPQHGLVSGRVEGEGLVTSCLSLAYLSPLFLSRIKNLTPYTPYFPYDAGSVRRDDRERLGNCLAPPNLRG